jgi:hypothetical protein
MRLHFYNQLLYGGRLADLAGLPREEQERITQHNRHLERCLGTLRCPIHPGVTSRVLPEWKKGKISFSLFTCCTVHAFDVQNAMRRLSLRGECLAGAGAVLAEEPTPAASPQPRGGSALLPALRSLLEAVWPARRPHATERMYAGETPVPGPLTA